MSSPGDTPELKAGHPPAGTLREGHADCLLTQSVAVKVAGMRVAQKAHPEKAPAASEGGSKGEAVDGDQAEKEPSLELEKKPKEKLVVSGVATKVRGGMTC